MTAPSISKNIFNRLGLKLPKWRLAFLIFIFVYAVILLVDLSKAAVQWDEVVHLNGALFLFQGKFSDVGTFYPPLFDIFTMFFFKVLGVTVFSARLVAVIFSILSIWVVFELVYGMYGGKAALLSSILLGVMPAFFRISRMAMIESMLVFFFTLSLFFFFRWLNNRKDKNLVFSGLALGLGFLTKYQVLIAVGIMIASILLLARNQIKKSFKKLVTLILVMVAVATPWIVFSYQIYASKVWEQWIYALQMGNPEKSLYSIRFPLPIFYFIELTWSYSDIHPISLLLYVVSLLGLGLFAWRRRKEDKFLLVWFIFVFVFFTIIANKHWRYVLPLFPVLAISGASFIFFLYEKTIGPSKRQFSASKKRLLKVAAGIFIIFLAAGLFFSIYDSYYWLDKENIVIDIEGATSYVASRINQNESIIVLSPFNLFSLDNVRFYLYADGTKQNKVYQYPKDPVDTFTPNFNITELIDLCRQYKAKYLFTYEYGGTVPYFNTTLNLQQIYEQVYNSGNFSKITTEATFGSNPRRIFILTFIGK